MLKEIKEIRDGVCRITTISERWYSRDSKNIITGIPEMKFYPSSTWIKGYYYKSPYLQKWINEVGADEAEVIKKEAGVKGDKVHQATEDIDKGKGIKIDDKYLNKQTMEMEELTGEEIEAIMTYRNWVDEVKPELVANEMTVFGERGEMIWAGTLDRIFRIDGQIYIVDLKTSKNIQKDMLIQVASYSHADIDYKALNITDEEWSNRKSAILLIGYKLNKNGYRFVEVDDRFDLFEVSYKIWQEENPNTKPFQRDYPLVIQSEWINQKLQGENQEVLKEIKKGKSKVASKK